MNKFAMSPAVAVLTVGQRITPFVSPWSTMDRIESNPFDLGRSVSKSHEIWAKGLVDVGPSTGCRAGLDGFLLILNC